MKFFMILLPLILFFITVRLMAGTTQSVVGWHWYNEKSVIKKSDHHQKNADLLYVQFQKLPYHEQLKILQQATEELKDKAVLTGNVSDIAAYKRAQDMWVTKATLFTVGWQHMLLENPNLNYSLQYSHENAMAPIMQQHEHQMQNAAIADLAKDNGLLLFYRGDNPEDLMFVKVMLSFSKDYHLSIMLIAENKPQHFIGVHHAFDYQELRAHALGVDYFPAVLLVNPKTGAHQIVSYGYKSEDELASRMLSIFDHWKPDF